MNLRPSATTVVVAATALALGATAPVVARGAFDAENAHKVDGLHAKDLARTAYFTSQSTIDDFNSCGTWVTLLKRTFSTSHAGVVSVVSQVNAARDNGLPDDGLLTAAVWIDGKRAGQPGGAVLTQAGTETAVAPVIGARSAGSGRHTIALKAQECGAGMAFVTNPSMTVTYSPFGSVEKAVVPARAPRNR